jgi:hypothetical protein
LNRASLRLRFNKGEVDPRIICARTTVGSYFDSTGTLQSAAINVPRLTYDPANLSSDPGLLAEESRTNDFLNSAVLSTQSITVTAAQRTVSFYGSGTLVLSGATSATLVGSASVGVRTVHTFTPTAGTLTATVTGSVLRAQCEIGASASSYIPTTTTAVTRSADNLSMTDMSWYQQSGGVLYVDGVAYSAGGLVGIDDGTNNNRARLGHIGSTAANAVLVSNGVQLLNSIGPGGSLPLGQVSKHSLRLRANNHAWVQSGVVRATGVTGALPAQPNRLTIGFGQASPHGNSLIREIAFIPDTSIPDYALQRMTR